MTNNQLCDLLGALSCIIIFFGIELVLFGITEATWAVAFGLLLGFITIHNYD